MWKKIKDFFIKKFFFLIDADEKQVIREKVMENDHKIYKALMIILMSTEFIMLVISFIKYGMSPQDFTENIYRGLYCFLFLMCLIMFILMEHFYLKKSPFKYYIFDSLFLLLIMLFGVGISLVDTYIAKTAVLTYFAISLIATSAFLTLEPWVPCLGAIIATVVFNVLYIAIPQFDPIVDPMYLIEIIVVLILCFVTSTFNFTRRIGAIRLQLQISNMNEALSHKALIDDLTHVYNRRYLTDNIDIPLDYDENGAGVVMLDIDHFKNINDTYGHQVGDECLSLLGIAINNLIREKESYCVRYGGEEFLIFFKNVTLSELKNYSETLRRRIEKMKVAIGGGVQIKYTISCGYSKALDGISYNILINQADEALYKAKEVRNRIFYYGDIEK